MAAGQRQNRAFRLGCEAMGKGDYRIKKRL
jgi:hypothetical protein